jgi:deoxyribodipyrimidine photolyase-like uncharacterized protein
MKNEKKSFMVQRQNLDWSADANTKMEVLIEETNQLWNFLQRFIDEQSVDRVKVMKGMEVNIKEKMNQMDWVARNSEFLSPDAITLSIAAFKEQYATDNATLRNAYIHAKHSSDSIITVVQLIDHTKMLNKDEETESRLAILLSIMEPLLINN